MPNWRLLSLLVLLGQPAAASIFDIYGVGAKATSMGGAQVAAANDYSGVYYNPGTLTVHKSPQVGIGFNLVSPSLSIEHSRLNPDGPSDFLPQTNVGVNLGVLFPLGKRFAVGIGAYLPTIHVTRVETPDGEIPQFYRLGALADTLTVAAAGAFEIDPTLSVGLGVQVLGSLDGSADIELDLLTRRFLRKILRVDIHTTIAMTGGVHWRPTKTLRLGISFRDALDLRYALDTRIKIKDIGLLAVSMSGTSLYTPQQFSTGAAYDPLPGLTVTADLIWSRWSTAPDPTANFELTLDGEPLGLETLEADSGPVDLGAEDTVSPRVGVEWSPSQMWAMRAGYAWSPTPLPAQTGYTNHIDSDLHQFAVGVGVRAPDPLALHRAPVTLNMTMQATIVSERQMIKQVDDDAVGDYSAGGVVWHGALVVRHEFY